MKNTFIYILGVSCLQEPLSAFGPRYMDLRKDYAYKRVFATESNKDLLIHFLNSLFEGKKKIINVEFRPTVRIGENEATKIVIYDVACTFFMLWKDPQSLTDPSRRYLRSVDVSWTATQEPFRDAKWIFVQLSAFNKKLEELDSDLQRWIYLMNNLHLLKEQPASLNHPVYRKLFNINEINKLNSEERQMYKLSFDNDHDWRNVISHARGEGEAIGEKQGKLVTVQNLIRELHSITRKSRSWRR